MKCSEIVAPCPDKRQPTITLHELQQRLDEDLVNVLLYERGPRVGFTDVEELLVELDLDLCDPEDDRRWSRIEQWKREQVDLALLLGARAAVEMLAGRPDLKSGDYDVAMYEVAQAHEQEAQTAMGLPGKGAPMV